MQLAIDQLVPHPLNSNVQAAGVRAKLKAHIRATGRYPAIIVRELARSEQWRDETRYQILDGENRWRILRELGHANVKVENWGALTDKQAAVLLASLNPLRGKDDPDKRATLLSVLRKSFGGDAAAVSQWVPESAHQIERTIETVRVPPAPPMHREVAKVRLSDTDETSDRFDPYTVLLPDEMARVVDAAIKLRTSRGDLPGDSLDPQFHRSVIGDYQRGRALYDICAEYVLRNTGGVTHE